MTVDEVMEQLASIGRPEVVSAMEKFGITTPKSFGIKTPDLKQFAREVKKQAADRHELAVQLWKTGNYDARAVAFLIDEPKQVTEEQGGQRTLITGPRSTERVAIFFAALSLPTKRHVNGQKKNRNS